jgi:hypothetical protein
MRTMRIRRISSAAALGLAVLFASCDSASDLTTPHTSAFATPQFSSTSPLFAVDGGPLWFDGGVKPGPGGGSTLGNFAGTNFTVVDGNAVTLSAGGNKLVISAGAMPRGTVVVMTVNPRNRFSVTLTATSKRARVVNDVGAAGFSKPVTLYVSNGAAPPPPFYGIALVVPKGLFPVPSSIEGNYVVGQLPHFSQFVVSMRSEYSMAE